LRARQGPLQKLSQPTIQIEEKGFIVPIL
jgi:hypothetical protein